MGWRYSWHGIECSQVRSSKTGGRNRPYKKLEVFNFSLLLMVLTSSIVTPYVFIFKWRRSALSIYFLHFNVFLFIEGPNFLFFVSWTKIWKRKLPAFSRLWVNWKQVGVAVTLHSSFINVTIIGETRRLINSGPLRLFKPYVLVLHK